MAREYTRSISILGFVPQLGNIIYWEDFEHAHGFGAGGDGAAKIERTISKKASGACSLKLEETGTPSATDQLDMSIDLAVIPQGRTRFTTEFLINNLTYLNTFEFQLYLWTGVYYIIPGVRYDRANTKWQYYDSGGSYVDIPGSALPIQSNRWVRIQLIYDFTTKKYVSFSVGTEIFDLSNIDLRSPTSGTAPYTQIYGLFIHSGANQIKAYFDNILIDII